MNFKIYSILFYLHLYTFYIISRRMYHGDTIVYKKSMCPEDKVVYRRSIVPRKQNPSQMKVSHVRDFNKCVLTLQYYSSNFVLWFYVREIRSPTYYCGEWSLRSLLSIGSFFCRSGLSSWCPEGLSGTVIDRGTREREDKSKRMDSGWS